MRRRKKDKEEGERSGTKQAVFAYTHSICRIQCLKKTEETRELSRRWRRTRNREEMDDEVEGNSRLEGGREIKRAPEDLGDLGDYYTSVRNIRISMLSHVEHCQFVGACPTCRMQCFSV